MSSNMHYKKPRDRKYDRRDDRSRSRERSYDRNDRDNKPRDRNYRNEDRNKKFHVANLPLNITDDDMRREFNSFGEIEDIRIIKKNNNGQFLKDFYYAFVTMTDSKNVQDVLKNYNIKSGNTQWIVSSSKEKTRDREREDRTDYRNTTNTFNNNHNDYKRYDRRDSRERQSLDNNQNLQDRPDRNENSLLSNFTNILKQQGKNENKEYSNVLASILALPTDQLEKTMNNELNTQLGHINSQILVRELWIGNLPADCTQNILKKNLEAFGGEIDNIDFFPKTPQNFAFVRFKKVEQATKAFENSRTITLLLRSSNLKLSYSDHQRRLNIVGDASGHEKDEDVLPVIYIGYNTGVKIPNEKEFQDVFKQYAEIKNIMIKQAPPNSGLRSYVLVEFLNIEQTKTILKKFMKESNSSDRRSRLGDKRCELFILIKPKKHLIQQPVNTGGQYHFDQSMINSNMVNNNNNNNSNMFMNPNNKMPPNLSNSQMKPMFHPPQPFNMQMKNNLFENLQNGPPPMPPHLMNDMNPGLMGPVMGMQRPMMNPNDQMMGGMNMNPNFFPPPMMNPPPHNQMMNPHHQSRPPPPPPDPESSQLLDIISQMLSKEPEPEQKDLEHYWSGFLTRNKQHRVGVDASLVRGKEAPFEEYNLNISHRTFYDEVLKKVFKSVVVFTPSNELMNKNFEDYINYFNEKKRAGVVTTKNYLLYLMPPCEEADKIYHIQELQILGVLVDINAPAVEGQGQQMEIEPQKDVKKKTITNASTPPDAKRNYERNENSNDDEMAVAGLLRNAEFLKILNNLKND